MTFGIGLSPSEKIVSLPLGTALRAFAAGAVYIDIILL
jgi:hypothetical protein